MKVDKTAMRALAAKAREAEAKAAYDFWRENIGYRSIWSGTPWESIPEKDKEGWQKVCDVAQQAFIDTYSNGIGEYDGIGEAARRMVNDDD